MDRKYICKDHNMLFVRIVKIILVVRLTTNNYTTTTTITTSTTTTIHDYFFNNTDDDYGNDDDVCYWYCSFMPVCTVVSVIPPLVNVIISFYPVVYYIL